MNASFPISVTLLGIVILVRLLQSLKAAPPIIVTLSGIVILVRLWQLRNASNPIVVTLSRILYSESLAGANAFRTPSIIRQRLSTDANLPLNSVRLSQP